MTTRYVGAKVIDVSTIIPAYNAAPFVAKAIEGALAQAISQEIIVVDDGSTDATAAVVESYGTRVRLIRQENAGVSAARNRGIETAVGRFVAFLDADDVWHPQKLSRQLQLFQDDPELGTVICDEMHISIDGSIVQPSFLASRSFFDQLPVCAARLATPVAFLVTESFFPTSSVVVRSDLMRRAGMFDTSLSIVEDRDMWLRLAFLAPVGIVPIVLLRYLTGRAGSLAARSSSAKWAKSVFSVLIRHERQICDALSREGVVPKVVLQEQYRALGDVCWHADEIGGAGNCYLEAIRHGDLSSIWKWIAATTGTVGIARFGRRLLKLTK